MSCDGVHGRSHAIYGTRIKTADNLEEEEEGIEGEDEDERGAESTAEKGE